MKARFGRYVLLKKIAVGGMAEIYLAQRLSFGGFEKLVAIKKLLPEHRGTKVYEAMFLNEARIAGMLNHPHIVSLHDLGKLDDAYFMAMEYVHGVSGAELLRKAVQVEGSVRFAPAVRIIESMAMALDYSYRTVDLENERFSVVHHDVSPHNIQLGFDGAVKLLDFGVATRLKQPKSLGRRGKYAYMSPEAAAKKPLDHRSDLFALGIVLYEMTLGRRLFKAKSSEETLGRILSGDFAVPTVVNPEYPEGLSTLLIKALSVNPDDRYQTGADLAEALRGVASDYDWDLGRDAFVHYIQALYGAEIETRREALVGLAARSKAVQAKRRAKGGTIKGSHSLDISDPTALPSGDNADIRNVTSRPLLAAAEPVASGASGLGGRDKDHERSTGGFLESDDEHTPTPLPSMTGSFTAMYERLNSSEFPTVNDGTATQDAALHMEAMRKDVEGALRSEFEQELRRTRAQTGLAVFITIVLVVTACVTLGALG